jgi:16S rRNA G966 N2-methylase RsmD
MIREINLGSTESVLEEPFTKGLGNLRFLHPAGTFAITPASNILFRAIIDHADLLHGVGFDWGSGIGCQAILAARIPAVQMVYGLEISKVNVQISRQNATENGVEQKVRFFCSDSYRTFDKQDAREIDALRKKTDFVVSNPPSSEGDDGFAFRRMVLEGAKAFLKPGGIVLINASFQYGTERVLSLSKPESGYRYLGVAASTECVPFDLTRADLLCCLRNYALEEHRGGMQYTFFATAQEDERMMDARSALRRFEEQGVSPYTKWQTHLLQYEI